MNELQSIFEIDVVEAQFSPNYNIAPTQKILAIVKENQGRVLRNFHWGLVPFWAKDTSIGNRMINARSETVATKPSFRTAFKKRRCLILADGYYEWKGEKGAKQPMFITLADCQPFAFAGLWESWGHKEDPDSLYLSCTIITTNANESLRTIHPRMPVILDPSVHEDWLNPGNQDTGVLQAILSSGTVTEFSHREVSKRVNSVRNNSHENIQPIRPSGSGAAIDA